jgi:tungstate transport system ATP-binding protein
VPNFVLNKGEVTALIGPNGAGKTSLLLTLALLQPPTAGVIHFDGQIVNDGNILMSRRRMAVVFQDSLLFDMSVMGNLTLALRVRGFSRREAEQRAKRWLHQFGVADMARRPARSLSGGEAQRTSLARAFSLEPQLLFLDEPFAALDYPTRNALLNELGQALSSMNTTALFVTHDYTEIPYLAQNTAVIYGGKIVKYGGVRDVFGDEIFERKAWLPWEE